MFFIQQEGLCVASGLLIRCTVDHVGTEGVCKQKPGFLEIFEWKVGRKFGILCSLYQASGHQSFTKIFT